MLSVKCQLHVRSLEIFPGIGDDTYNMALYVLGNLNRHKNQLTCICASCMGLSANIGAKSVVNKVLIKFAYSK